MKRISAAEAVEMLSEMDYCRRIGQKDRKMVVELMERQDRMIQAACEELNNYYNWPDGGAEKWRGWLAEKAGEEAR